MRITRLLAISIVCLVAVQLTHALEVPGTIHVISHDRVKVVTDPSKGFKEYPARTAFPSMKTSYRKVTLWVTYACPDSVHCGEWDYIDAVYLRRHPAIDSTYQDIELARIISPYGRNFAPDWKFTWHVDITDFSLLLHDSVEIVFKHTGYESNTDRGWLVTADFECVEGTPAMTCLGMDSLWCGSFPFGDTSKPIETVLKPLPVNPPKDARIARVRIVQTGHGMDDSANCAEFCEKYRSLYFDTTLINQRQIWRQCGTNPLSPQAGTWIFNRANWCPGSMVAPDRYDIPVKPGAHHTVDIAMEPYINPNHPSANYVIYSYLFYYAEPKFENDVSLEEIIAPSNADEYLRLNPICAQPVIRIKNNGRSPLRSVDITYGVDSESLPLFHWQGMLGSQMDTLVYLPGMLDVSPGIHRFHAALDSPNGKKDEYPLDDYAGTNSEAPPIYPPKFILAFRTNHDSSHNGYQLIDQNGVVVREKKVGTLAANTPYRDTLDLKPGCYQLLVQDTSGDGLDFWFNPEGGYGYVRLLDMTGRLLKPFTSDFGSEIRYSFSVSENGVGPVTDIALPLVNPFPMRNKGTFTVELFFNEPHDSRLQILNEDSSKVIYDTTYTAFKEGFLPIDIASSPDGIYWVKVTADSSVVTRKIKIKHQD